MSTLYETKPKTWYGGFVMRFLEALDLSENIVRVTKALVTIPNGAVALVLALVALLPSVGFSSLAWYFDIDSSWVAMEGIRTSIEDRLTAITAGAAIGALLGFLAQAIPWALTLLPTATEMLGSKFARFSVASFQWAVWFFVVYDALTDIPRINEELSPYWPTFVGAEYADAGFFGILFSLNPGVWGAALGYHLLWLLALAGASYFLELLAVLSIWTVFALLYKSLVYWALKFVASRGWVERFNKSGGFDTSNFKSGGPRKGGRATEEEADEGFSFAGASVGGGRRKGRHHSAEAVDPEVI